MVGPAMKAAIHSLTAEGRKEERQKAKEQKEQRKREKEQEKQIKEEKKNPKPKEKEGEETDKEMNTNTNNTDNKVEKKTIESDGDKVKETKTTEKKSDWNSSPGTEKKTETRTTEKNDPQSYANPTSTTTAKKTEVHPAERNIAISPLDLEDRIRQLELQKKEDRDLMLSTEDEIIKRLELKRIAAENRLREADEEIYRLRTQAILENEKHHSHHKEHKHKEHHTTEHHKEHKHHHKDHTEHKHKEHHVHPSDVPVANVSTLPQTQNVSTVQPTQMNALPPSARSVPPMDNQKLILTQNETNQAMYPQNGMMGMKGPAVPFQTPIVSTTMLPPSNIEQN
eukprot:TRINITY_DN1804_c0_g1_i1.p1 TRINITY_DN1804_c0_g1~~TRINITY_DN1804_c0_g1_i1.p1  ORF type:complete len:339 (-),score=146.73 TRINITY_DN1804_c0_g1_i1:93-1109(-)